MNPFVRDNLSFSLRGKKILLGITGSIAAFKACDIVRFLKACGAEVRVVLSQGAENFVTRTTLETLSGSPVLHEFWDQSFGNHHIDTARWADLILVAPATAHFIAKIANGFADDLLSTEILAFHGPLLVAPAMNPNMFSHPATQENVARLRARGVQILGPVSGVTSCGEEGLGRMVEPDQIVEKTAAAFYKGFYSKKIVITLGPTRSALDPVRYLTNRSSGKMGAALCWAAVERGYSVTAVCGPSEVPLPEQVLKIPVQTARQMLDASVQAWKMADIFIATAAVLDWDVKNPATQKLKKGDGMPVLDLVRNEDILKRVSESKKAGQFVLGFAAETREPIVYGFKKLQEKGCDAVFANQVSLDNQGFESDLNSGWLLFPPDSVVNFEKTTKAALARQLIERISKNA